jgi:D-alanine-D-alanine ligase
MSAKRVALVFGGISAEHEVSLASAAEVRPALESAGYEVVPVRVAADGSWWFSDSSRPLTCGAGIAALAEAGLDVVFPLIHGSGGEDGRLQGLLRVLRLPFVGSGVLASALAMDKARCKAFLQSTTSIPLVRSRVVDRFTLEQQPAKVFLELQQLGSPCIVKPVNGGSSVGLTKVSKPADASSWKPAMRQALAVAFENPEHRSILVEEFVSGEEVTVGVVGNPESGLTALPVVLVRPAVGDVFDYHAKYTPGAADEICPAPLPEEQVAHLQEQARAAYLAVGCRGMARVDFIVRDSISWFLELNTLPGFTSGSLLPLAARAQGWDLPELVDRLVQLVLPGEQSGSSWSRPRQA